MDHLPESSPSTIAKSSITPWSGQRYHQNILTSLRGLVGDRFTLSQLHDVYEAIAEEDIDLANFAAKMLASGLLEDTATNCVGRNRPATVYRYKQANGSAQPTPWNVAGQGPISPRPILIRMMRLRLTTA